MNPAIHAALMAASEQKPDIEGRLREAKAFDTSRAIEIEPADDTEQKWLDEAIGLGIVSRSANGRIHLNERVLDDRRQGQGMMVIVILLILASLIASGIALTLTR